MGGQYALWLIALRIMSDYYKNDLENYHKKLSFLKVCVQIKFTKTASLKCDVIIKI